MESYFLNTLIFFFKEQREIKYEAIEQVLDLIDDEKVPDIKKRDLILAILHKYGLNETTYNNGRFKHLPPRRLGNKHENGYRIGKRAELLPFPVEVIDVRILNAALSMRVTLN
jgi:hypothetical protein